MQLADGTFKASATNLQEITGNVYVTMGAQSQKSGVCNSVLYTSFTVNDNTITAVKNTDTVVVNITTQEGPQTIATVDGDHSDNSSTVAENETVEVIIESNEDISVSDDVVETEQLPIAKEKKGLFAWVTGLFTNDTSATEDSLLTQENNDKEFITKEETKEENLSGLVVSENTTNAQGQQASIFDVFNKDNEICSTVGSNWSWYVYLGIIWLWLVAVWVAISYYAEPAFGTGLYSKRLTIIVSLAGVAGLLLWYVTNPCLTHAWLPATFVALSILLHWLYSEDTHHSDT